MRRAGSYRGRACELIVALQDGPKTLAGLADWLGLAPGEGNAKGVRLWLSELEHHGLVRRTKRPAKSFATGAPGDLFEWVTQ